MNSKLALWKLNVQPKRTFFGHSLNPSIEMSLKSESKTRLQSYPKSLASKIKTQKDEKTKKGVIMATFITLVNFTEKGIHEVKQTVDRASAFQETAKKMGINILQMLWTMGSYDLVLVFEAPDAATASALNLRTGTVGHVRTQTFQAFNSNELNSIFAKF